MERLRTIWKLTSGLYEDCIKSSLLCLARWSLKLWNRNVGLNSQAGMKHRYFPSADLKTGLSDPLRRCRSWNLWLLHSDERYTRLQTGQMIRPLILLSTFSSIPLSWLNWCVFSFVIVKSSSDTSSSSLISSSTALFLSILYLWWNAAYLFFIFNN